MKMLSDIITCLILSCSKFSDLWDGNVKLFNENWPDKDFGTFIVTDGPTDVKYPGVGIIAAGEGVEWSERLSLALKQVRTEFVFVTMDDYYLVKPVDSQRIADLVALMGKEGYDYLRLYPRPKRATREKVPGYKGVYHVPGKKCPDTRGFTMWIQLATIASTCIPEYGAGASWSMR